MGTKTFELDDRGLWAVSEQLDQRLIESGQYWPMSNGLFKPFRLSQRYWVIPIKLRVGSVLFSSVSCDYRFMKEDREHITYNGIDILSLSTPPEGVLESSPDVWTLAVFMAKDPSTVISADEYYAIAFDLYEPEHVTEPGQYQIARVEMSTKDVLIRQWVGLTDVPKATNTHPLMEGRWASKFVVHPVKN